MVARHEPRPIIMDQKLTPTRASSPLPRRHESMKNMSLLARLIRHFSSHSNGSNTSSPTHGYDKFGTLERRARKGSSRSSRNASNGIPSSISNGDVRGHNNQQVDCSTALSIPICGVKNHGNTCYMNAGKISRLILHRSLLIFLIFDSFAMLVEHGSAGRVFCDGLLSK